MKKVILMAATAATLAACGEPVEHIESRDIDDVTGTYEVDYKVWLDGKPVSEAAFSGRVEVSGKPIHELSMKFWPDAPVLTVPSWNYDKSCESIPLWPIRPVGYAGTYTFDGYRSYIGLDWAERSSTDGPLTMSGKISAKSSEELVADGSAYMSNGSCLYVHPLPSDPDAFHNLAMTIDFEVVDPTLPGGTEIFPEQGIGVHKFHIEIASR